MTTIRQLAPDVTIFSAPFSRFGLFKIGARATALGVTNTTGTPAKDVIIVSPIAASPEIEAALVGLGTVKYLVAPDREHHLQLEDYAKRYPEAKIIGVEGLPEKHPNLTFFKVFGNKAYDHVTEIGWENEVEAVYFPGHGNKELALFHKPSSTLVEADLLFNLPPIEQYSKSGGYSTGGMLSSLSPFAKLKADSKFHQWFNVNVLCKDKVSFKASLAQVDKWPFQRIVPCHGDVIEQNAKGIWQTAFSGITQ
ncbi:hypothetical protein BCR37DRAFT_348051 [Protomyces lactucae-debilis]|uniref:Beta-lactamase-like protein n=1 Tax=Protomyces lactucae-debilis TaxID=2754530 RepID=A0A1Y2FBR0_PROLT|nr:uncharacterized protein BCR37DRAFT_348051 [Protomyces lactucae-debilis]ORY81321.1 hypothetical protein BCR37DRAFT_348051 [Protomyces lactucae-debilis]